MCGAVAGVRPTCDQQVAGSNNGDVAACLEIRLDVLPAFAIHDTGLSNMVIVRV